MSELDTNGPSLGPEQYLFRNTKVCAMKKLRDLLNEVGYIGLVSRSGFKKGSPASSKHIREDEEDWYSDDPEAPEPMYGDDDQFDTDPGQEDTERVTAIYRTYRIEASLDDIVGYLTIRNVTLAEQCR